MKIYIMLLLAALYSFTLSANPVKPLPPYLEIGPAVNAINMIMIHDVVPPPVAARFYAYAMLTAYQIVSQSDKKVPAPGTFTKQFPANLTPPDKDYDHQIAAIYGLMETIKIMMPSGYMIQEDQDKFTAALKTANISEAVITQSTLFAKKVTAQVVAFSKSDNYGKLSTRLRYTPKKGEGYWYPTPPAYLDAVEPNWKTIRPMVIDSAAQFKPTPAIEFSKDSTSAFYKLAKEVYDVSVKPTDEVLMISSFWDCNPFAVTTSGHMMIGFKKISPAGHWMNIACLAVKQSSISFNQSILVVTVESIALMDAFLSCWDEKYRSSRIRPETYINKYIDLNWKPFLQTPPFPEYTSGHAVGSNASATVLTYLMGDNYKYIDDTEIPYGVGPRPFSSFNQAAEEASISRLYGGIHFRDSIQEGNKQGRDVGNHILEKIKKAGIGRKRK
jgi:hypothetical protein